MKKYEDHEIASCWPLMDDDEIAALAKNIKEQTQLNPIHIYEGKILDGRNRYRACKVAGVKPVTVEYSGADPVGFAIAANDKRRRDSLSQRALTAARLANLPHGYNRYNDETPNGVSSSGGTVLTIADAARAFGVGTSSVDRGHVVLTEGSPELIDKVQTGKMTLSAAWASLRPPVAPTTKLLVLVPPLARSNLMTTAMRTLGTIALSGLRYNSIKSVIHYLLECYPELKDEQHELYNAIPDSLDLAAKVITALRTVPIEDTDRADAFREMYVLICEGCPDLDEGRRLEAAAAGNAKAAATAGEEAIK